jgi:hypothetical protein
VCLELFAAGGGFVRRWEVRAMPPAGIFRVDVGYVAGACVVATPACARCPGNSSAGSGYLGR